MKELCPCYLCRYLNRDVKGLYACTKDPLNIRYARRDYYYELLSECPLGFMYFIQPDSRIAFTR